MAPAPTLAAFLATMPLLRGLPGDALARLAQRAPPPRTVEPGGRAGAGTGAIYDVRDASTALYVVLDETAPGKPDGGRPVVQVSVEDDKFTTRVRLWKVYPRDYFGDLEFLAGTESGRFPIRLTKAVALSPARILEIPFKLLNELVDEHPILFRRLAREAIGRFQQTLEDTLAGKVSDPDIALANWIVERARDFGVREGSAVRFRKSIGQEDIGRDLGVSRETVSLRLSEWRRRGLMASVRGQFVVRDMDRVERIAALAVERSRDEHRAAVDAIDAALGRGDNFRARNFALDVLDYYPGSAELKHRAALAVARCGATREALALLERFGLGRDATPETIKHLVRSGVADPLSPPKMRKDDFDDDDLDEQIRESGEQDRVAGLTEDLLALAPRLWKDLAFKSSALDVGAAREAMARYRAAFKASGRPYTGVNAASLAFLAGDADEARTIAAQAQRRLTRTPTSYWDHATEAEVLLLLGKEAEARAHLEAALGASDALEGSIAATRLQLRRLAEAGLRAAGALLPVLTNATVALLYAATADPVDEDVLTAMAGEALVSRRVGHAYSSLLPGAETAMAEAALAKGAALHVVLPLPVEDFAAAHGAQAPGWRARFESCLAQAASLTVATQRSVSARDAPHAVRHGLRHAAGQALTKADSLQTGCALLLPDGSSVTAVRPLLPEDAFGEDGVVALSDAPAGKTTSARAKVAETPWRPVLFVWVTAAADGQLSARGIGEDALAAVEAVVTAQAGKDARLLRRIIGGNRPQSAIVAVLPDAAAAVALAEQLLAASWPDAVAVQITLDLGPVLGAGGAPSEDRLKDLDIGGGPLEASGGLILASTAFAMEARLALGRERAFIALGRVGRLEAGTGALQLLPSTEIFALTARE